MPRAFVVALLQSNKPTFVDVSAGILADENGRILITQRMDDGLLDGLWEFPGGKIAAGESAESALIRELHEEIGINVTSCVPFMRLTHDYPDRSVRLQFFKVNQWLGKPVGVEGQKLRWLQPGEIDLDLILPADAPVIEALLA